MQNKYLFVFCLISFIFLSNLSAQPLVEWEKEYGGSYIDEARCIIQTNDGGYAVTGYTGSNDGDVIGLHNNSPYGGDIWLLKLNANGDLEWQKCIGGSGGDAAYSTIQTRDGGFAIAGVTDSNDGDSRDSNVTGKPGNEDIWILKLDKFGAIEWQRTYGGKGEEYANSIIQTADGGFAVAATTNSTDGDVTHAFGNRDIWILKLDQVGALEWERSYGGSANDDGCSIVQTVDGGFAFAGTTGSRDGDVKGVHGQYAWDAWLVRINNIGNILWQRCLGGSENDNAYSLVYTSDHGFALAMSTSSFDGDLISRKDSDRIAIESFWLAKLDSNGMINWSNAFGVGADDEPHSIFQTDDGRYVAAGYALSILGRFECFVEKLDNEGVLQWFDTLYGSNAWDADMAYSIIQSSDGGYVFAGDGGNDLPTYHQSPNAGILNRPADFLIVKLRLPCTDLRISLPNIKLLCGSGQYMNVPILSLDSTTYNVSVFDFTLNLNTDLLTPLSIDVNSGFFKNAIIERFNVYADSVSIRLRLTKPKHLVVDTLCLLHCEAFISDSNSTPITIQRFFLEDSLIGAPCLSAQSIGDSTASFTLKSQCGDQTLSEFLKGVNILSIDRITPNPTTSNINVKLHIPKVYRNDGVLEVYDALGNLEQKQTLQFGEYHSSENIALSLIGSSGLHYIRISSPSGVSTQSVILEK